MAALLAVTVGTSSAAHPEATLPGSNFEIDDDANLVVDDAGNDDWVSVTQVRQDDLPTGQNDDSYKGGVKEDTPCPAQVTGSIPNNKSDLLSIETYEEPGTPGFFNFAWSRVSDPSGTTLMDFEFNQSTTACPQGPNVVRTPGDLLIEYAIDQGGARANITAREWTGSEWGPEEALDIPNPACGGDPCAAGTINSTAISAANSDGLGDKAPRTFGEAQIDLDYIFDDGSCVSFGSVMVKSRSSDSFNSQLKDFITPVPISLTNCGKVIVRKVTDPADSGGTTFDFASDVATDPANGSIPPLAGGDSHTINNVLFGSYNISEEEPTPAGWEFVSIDCSASTGVNPSIDGAGISFTIDNDADVVDCTWTNRARASLTFVKDADFDGVDFAFAGSGVPDFTLANGGSVTFDDLSPGTYGATETVPAGWALESTDCDNGDTADDVTLAAGDDVTCTFVNRIRGDITYAKVADRAGVDFDFDGSFGPFSLADGESTNFADLPAGTYGSTETVPAGWNLVSATCDNGDDPSAVDIDEPGESVTCTFVNEIQTGAIIVTKTAKSAAAGGLVPVEGVDFAITNATNGTEETITTDALGGACIDGLPVSALDGDYTVTETVPAGYAQPDPVQVVTVAESTCADADGVVAAFENIPLTNVTVSVDSQVDGGTASVIECTSDQGTVSATTGADGDGSLTVTDLQPTDPAVTITCTVVVDP